MRESYIVYCGLCSNIWHIHLQFVCVYVCPSVCKTTTTTQRAPPPASVLPRAHPAPQQRLKIYVTVFVLVGILTEKTAYKPTAHRTLRRNRVICWTKNDRRQELNSLRFLLVQVFHHTYALFSGNYRTPQRNRPWSVTFMYRSSRFVQRYSVDGYSSCQWNS